MSYILDALKRADAERERGLVPGLYARQVTSTGPRTVSSTPRWVWLALLAGVALAAVAVGLGAWRSASDAPPKQVLVPAALPAPVAASAVQPAAPPIAVPVPVTAAPAPAVAAPVVAALVAVAKPVQVVVAPAVPSASASRSASVAVPLLAELPEEIRRQIPALTITGAVYSDNPAQRLLLVNNLVLNQGSQAGPDLTLDEIGSKSSVFSFRGTRFRLAH